MGEKNVKQPVRGGKVKVPVIMQMEALECGAASLAMIMAYYGKWVPLEQVRLACGVSRDGSNARNIIIAARNYGLVAEGDRLEIGALRKDVDLPCIIHWNFNHFVVLDGFRGNYAYINGRTLTVPTPASACILSRVRNSSRAASRRARWNLRRSAWPVPALRWPLCCCPPSSRVCSASSTPSFHASSWTGCSRARTASYSCRSSSS